MKPTGDLLPDEVKLPVMTRSTAGPSILLCLFIFLVFIPPFLRPAVWWTWAISIVSLAAVVFLFLHENRRFFATADRLICRAFLRHEEIEWHDVEAIGTHVLTSKHGPIGTTFIIYSAQRIVRPMFSPAETGDFSRLIHERCPGAVWIQEDEGTFSLPHGGDEAAMREIVARHAQRLRKHHLLASLCMLGMLIPIVAWACSSPIKRPIDMLPIAFCLLLFVAFSWSHWAALWRLRR